MKREEYIEKWLIGTLTEDEQARFEATDDFKAFQKLDRALQAYKAPAYDVEEALTSLHKKTQKEAKVITILGLDNFLRVAAVVVLALFGYLLVSKSPVTTVRTDVAQKEEVKLPDRTTVQLNASSSLAYNANTWSEQRKVDLTGEAFFEVMKGSRFDVNTKDGIVTVLGTQFNVNSRDAYFEVKCFEGHVAVIFEMDTVHLLATQGVRVVDGNRLRLAVAGHGPSWTNNESSFDSVPYREVLAEFERQYGVNINTKDVDLNQHFSGSFTHKNYDVALKSITLPLNLKIEKASKKHIVLSVDQDH